MNYSTLTSETTFNVTIQNYTLTPLTTYTFKLSTIDPSILFSVSRNITIEIAKAGLNCQFTGTKKIYNYRKDAIIYINCRDLDSQYDWNEDPDLSIDVKCLDLIINS